MSGETNLQRLIQTMSATLADDLYVFVAQGANPIPSGIRPIMVFQEAEGTTLICRHQEALDHQLAYEFPCRMITLNVHSALEAVGFIAKIASALAAQGMGVNPVSGFYHDHLFIPDGREQDALQILEKMAKEASISTASAA